MVDFFDVAFQLDEYIMNDLVAEFALLPMQRFPVATTQLIHILRVIIRLEDFVELVVVSEVGELLFELLRKFPRILQVILHVVALHLRRIQLLLQLLYLLRELSLGLVTLLLQGGVVFLQGSQLAFITLFLLLQVLLVLMILKFEKRVKAQREGVPEHVE